MKIKTKNKKWRYVYRKFGNTQRFNIENIKERSQIRVMEVKKSYIWRDSVKAVTVYFQNLEPNVFFYRFALAFLPFIADLIFGKVLNIYGKSHSR